MRVDIQTEKRTGGAEVVDYNLDGSPIFSEHPRTVDVASYYDNSGTLIGRTFDNLVYYLISDETEEKLSRLIEETGVVLTAERKWHLCHAIDRVFCFAEEQFWTHSSVRNQEALRQLINAYEALGDTDRVTLTEAFLHKAQCNLPMARNWQDEVFLEAAKGLLDKGEGGKPPTFGGALDNLRQATERLLVSFDLEPDGKDKMCFDGWMKALLKDPALIDAEKEWRDHEEKAEALLKERMPDTARGKKVGESAHAGGKANAEEIRKRKGGALLSERRAELKHRLQVYRIKGHSHKRACELLAEQPDIPWSAEYLRKKIRY